MIRRWELIDVDTERGDVLGHHGRYFTRRGAERWRRRLNRWLIRRCGAGLGERVALLHGRRNARHVDVGAEFTQVALVPGGNYPGAILLK